MADSFTLRQCRRRYDSAFGDGASSSASSSTSLKRQRSIKTEDEDELFVRPHSAVTPPGTQPPTTAPASDEAAYSLAVEQKVAIDVIMQGKNVFLTGSAGSGKTLVLNEAIRGLHDQGKRVSKAAPTGKAALNINGSTIHHLFSLTPAKQRQPIRKLENGIFRNKWLRARLAEMDVLIIDEVSMVENIFFEQICRFMQAAKVNNRPFGGVQVIVCGDFRQLPPVKPFGFCFNCGNDIELDQDRDCQATLYCCRKCGTKEYDPVQWAFASQAWESAAFTNINLMQNHRQNEGNFVAILRKLAAGSVLNSTDRNLLYDHQCDVQGAVYLFARNDEVDNMNAREFQKLGGKAVKYLRDDRFRWNERHGHLRFINDDKAEDGRTLKALKDHRHRPIVELKKGQPVVLTINLDVEGGLVNGSQGTIVDFKIYEKSSLPYSGAGINHAQLESGILPTDVRAEKQSNSFRGGEYAAYRHERVKQFIAAADAHAHLPVVQFYNGHKRTILPDCNLVQLGDEWPPSLLSRTQVPLIAAWAMTVHKAQGMTMDKVVVNVSNMENSGQAYVALSRARSLFGLEVEGSEEALDKAFADPLVTAFMRDTTWTVE